MAQDRTRILVDRSRDSIWSDKLVNMEPDNVYQVTDNRDYLNWSVLKNYDVLTVCGYSPLEYSNEELETIRKFVESGGGLLLASSSSRFQQDVGGQISGIHANKVARLFGAEFLPMDVCRGRTKYDDELLNGYPREDLRLAEHAVLAELELDDIPISNCGIIAVPEAAQVFMEHDETREPVGACLRFGKGRVLIINDLTFSQDSQPTCRAFIDWLACNRVSKVEGDGEIPDEIPVDEHVKEDGRIKIYYNDFVKERVDTCLEFAKKVSENLSVILTDQLTPVWEIELNPSCTYRHNWRESISRVGAFMSDSRLTYALGVKSINSLDIERDLGDLIWRSGFQYRALSEYLGTTAMRLLGFQREADEIYAEIVRQFREKDPTGHEFDITEVYEYHPKMVWVITTLTEKYGQNLLARFIKAVPDPKDPRKNIPGSLFSILDVFIYYLSLGLGENLYPWFQEIGTTVHPLPLHPSDSGEFKQGILQYVKDTISDKADDASTRSDALRALMDIYDKEKKIPPNPPLEEGGTGADDKYERLAGAIRLSSISDSRAIHDLQDLASDEEDSTLAAIAALALVRQGRASTADRLIETAREQDCRFQLDAAYALHKIGHPKAEELSLERLRDENGDPVVLMKEEYTGYLKLFPMVAGHKVANIFTSLNTVEHFPENTHATGVWIDWVYTDSLYRRKGLSRWAMQQTMAHKAVRRFSYATLGTGTRNIAHAMYRSFGFVDVFYSEDFTRELREEKAKVVDGLLIRSYSPGDEVKMAELANERYSTMLGEGRARARRRRLSSTYIKIAEKDGGMLGYAQATRGRSKEEAYFEEIFLKKVEHRDDIGAALLCALNNDLTAHGFKKISMFQAQLMEDEFLRKLFHNSGYSSRRTGGVYMFKIINLPMLLEEISPLLSKRLKDSDYKDWHGRIGIAGHQHRASLAADNGEVSISEEGLDDADILISANDDIITRIILGRITPFEAYLQTDLSIQPAVNDGITGLLDTVFPRIPKQE
jgi:GNAT superfamily N-acetyltransferase/putative sterol carrier protein